jgi:hypothetical protein
VAVLIAAAVVVGACRPAPLVPISPAPTTTTSLAPVPDRLTCAGYPEPRVFLESQGWWRAGAGVPDEDAGHVHVGTCFPYGRTVRGVVELDVRVVMAHNPGTVDRVQVGLVTGDGVGTAPVQARPGLTCDGHAPCTTWIKLRLDTTQAAHDGRAEVRFMAHTVQPSGLEMSTTTGWPLTLANGKPVSDYRTSDVVVGRGWYTDAGYVNADLLSVIPTAPITGVWRPEIKMKEGADGLPATSWNAFVDPDFHAMPEQVGTVVSSGIGSFRGALAIDTATLTPGRHRLVLRTDAAQPGGAVHSGLLVVPFVVAG